MGVVSQPQRVHNLNTHYSTMWSYIAALQLWFLYITPSMHTEIHPRRGTKNEQTQYETRGAVLGLNIAGNGLNHIQIWLLEVLGAINCSFPARWACANMQSNINKATCQKKHTSICDGPTPAGMFQTCLWILGLHVIYRGKQLNQFQATWICPTILCPNLCCLIVIFIDVTCSLSIHYIHTYFPYIFPWKPPFPQRKTLANTPSAGMGLASANFRARSAKLKSFASKRLLTSSWDQLSAGGVAMLSHPLKDINWSNPKKTQPKKKGCLLWLFTL